MKVVLDACVLYPTVMREMLLGVAKTGAYVPVWSARILEEWARAARKLGPEGEVQARGEIALIEASWPRASIAAQEALEARLWLPDAADIHVLATAIASSADLIVTLNAKDFPRDILAEEGVDRRDPDSLLMTCYEGNPDAVIQAAERVLATARRLSGEPWSIRPLLKKARLPRLAKTLQGVIE